MFNRLLKNSLGVLRQAQDERRSFDFPFMLRFSKHSELFQPVNVGTGAVTLNLEPRTLNLYDYQFLALGKPQISKIRLSYFSSSTSIFQGWTLISLPIFFTCAPSSEFG
jgi:hypothetical protein